jgi:hypothetical protein
MAGAGWSTSTRTKKLKTRPPPPKVTTAKTNDSSEDEKPAPEDDGDEHQAKGQACLARLGALVGIQVQVCMFSLPTRHRVDSIQLISFNLFAHLGFVGREHGDLGGGGPLER